MVGIGEGKRKTDANRQRREAYVSAHGTKRQEGSGLKGWSKKRPGSGKQ